MQSGRKRDHFRTVQGRGVLIKGVKDKKGIYVLPRLIPVYIIVGNELAYDEAYAQLLKYIDNLKRLVFMIGKKREGMRKERFIKTVPLIKIHKLGTTITKTGTEKKCVTLPGTRACNKL